MAGVAGQAQYLHIGTAFTQFQNRFHWEQTGTEVAVLGMPIEVTSQYRS